MACMISVSPASGCPGYLVSLDGTDRDILVQTDWDYPGLASTFGASLRMLVPVKLRDPAGHLRRDSRGKIGLLCSHDGTDGTIPCPECGTQPSTFIAFAAEYLDAGPDPVEDPGYFDEEAEEP